MAKYKVVKEINFGSGYVHDRTAMPIPMQNFAPKIGDVIELGELETKTLWSSAPMKGYTFLIKQVGVSPDTKLWIMADAVEKVLTADLPQRQVDSVTQKYRLTRDNAANGTAINTVPVPSGTIAPKLIYLTKQFKKGDIVEGLVATEDSIFAKKGKSLLVKASNGVTTTNGVPYSGEVTLALSLDNGALEKLDETQKSLRTSSDSIFTTKNILIGLASVGVLFGILKFTKII